MQKAFITGLAGAELTADERAFLARERPAGLILFTRNCQDAGQIRRLVADFKAAVGSDRVLVLIDQEGGRVQRLKPPIARLLPPAAAFAAQFPGNPDAAAAAAHTVARLTADDLKSLGIDTSCAPVLDVPVSGAHDIIGNRAYSRDPGVIVHLGGAVADGLMAGGVLPVMKHIPGHGRALSDSHLELPVVTATEAELAASDLVPFTRLARIPAAMTAHVVFNSLDASAPASTSRHVTDAIIRGRIGFNGLLMSDDLGMKALTGTFAERTRAVIDAGSDLALHCNGDLSEMQAVASAAPVLQGRALQRFDRALAVARATPQPYDRAAAEAVLAELLAIVA